MDAKGAKFDGGKPPMSLLDRVSMEEIAQVMRFGADKYGRYQWRGGIHYSRLLDAALRHLYAFADGEDNDNESGLSHVAHAGCCIMFLLRMCRDRADLDDRVKQLDLSRDMEALRAIIEDDSNAPAKTADRIPRVG